MHLEEWDEDFIEFDEDIHCGPEYRLYKKQQEIEDAVDDLVGEEEVED